MTVGGRQPESETATSQEEPNRVQAVVAALVLVLIAFSFIGWGMESIATRRHQFEWKEKAEANRGRLTVGSERQHVEVYAGAEAVRMGVGCVFAGVIAGIWGATCLLCAVREEELITRFQTTRPFAAAASLVCLAVVFACFFPPWRLESLWFWADVLFWVGFLILCLRMPTIQPWARWLSIGTVIAAAVVGIALDISGAWVGVTVGHFAALIGLLHLIFIAPQLQLKLHALLNGGKNPTPLPC